MPCNKCNSHFTLLNWKLKCYECDENHCSRCLSKKEGYVLCSVCAVLLQRPPVRENLMELRVNDLRNYLNKNKISTHGLVEKQELVELFFTHLIPVRLKRRSQRYTSTFGGSVPNLTARSQIYLNNLGSTARTYISNATRNMTQTPFAFNNPPETRHHRPQNSNNTYQSSSASASPPFSPPPAADTEHKPPRKYPKLSDYKSEQELSNLSVLQLKELLVLNRVDFKGCVEKAELLDRVKRLWNDDNKHKNDDFSEGFDDCCKICMDAPLDCVLLECGHIATCINCGKVLNECPICRQYVTRVVRTFKA